MNKIHTIILLCRHKNVVLVQSVFSVHNKNSDRKTKIRCLMVFYNKTNVNKIGKKIYMARTDGSQWDCVLMQTIGFVLEGVEG